MYNISNTSDVDKFRFYFFIDFINFVLLEIKFNIQVRYKQNYNILYVCRILSK